MENLNVTNDTQQTVVESANACNETGGAVSLRVACAPVVLQHPLQIRAVRTGSAEGSADRRRIDGTGVHAEEQ